MTPRHALPRDPFLSTAGPRRALRTASRAPQARTVVAATATLASVALGCAVFLPSGGAGQPVAIAQQKAASEAAQLAALGKTSPSQTSVQQAPVTSSAAAASASTTTTSPAASASPAPVAAATPAPQATTTTSKATTTTTTKATTTSAPTEAETTTASPKATATTKAPAVSSAAEQVVAYARDHLGYPYEVGTMGPDYYDCAGLVAAAYRSAGYDMPFSEAEESSGGTYVALEDLQPGDVVVWGSPVHSVSIYAGGGVIIIADGPDYGIRTVTMDERLSWDTFAGGRRYLG